MTTVINLFGGPGTGKSTLAAELFYKLKMAGKDVELVREYIKDWAYENKKIGKYDQIYIGAKQAKKEYSLYGKVDFIVTDSPILISPFYNSYYGDIDLVGPSTFALLRYIKGNGIKHYNFFLKRNKPYNTKGRYENEDQAKGIDVAMKDWLIKNGIDFIEVNVADTEKAEFILGTIK